MKTKISTKHTGRQGFTLVELLTVIAIVVILAGLSVSALSWANTKSTKEKTKVQLRLLENGIQQYYADVGSYPEAQGLGSARTGGQDSMYIYAMCFGDVGDDGAVKVGRRGPGLSFVPNKKGTIYLDELDPSITGNPWFDKTPSPSRLVDPYGKAWYYRSGQADNMNPDFDIWSSGLKSDPLEDQDDITNW